MRIVTDNHIFELDEPAGREGRQLFRAASAVIAECGWVPPGSDPEHAAAHVDRFIFALAGHRQGDAMVLATLGGGTMDGSPVTAATLDSLPVTHVKEAFDATFQAWAELGFFGHGLRQAVIEGAKALGETTETLTSA